MKIRTKIIASFMLFAVSSTSVQAQGVPVIDQTNILKSVEQLKVMLENLGVQNNLLTQAKEQFNKLQEQLGQLKNIYSMINGLRNIKDLDFKSELSSILSGSFSGKDMGGIGNIISTFNAGASGDWSGLTSGKSTAMKQTIDKSLKAAGLSQETISSWSSSNEPSQKRVAQQAASGAALAATAEQSYKEAGQSLERVKTILEDTKNSEDIKGSIDNNTRMLAELSIQLAKGLEIASIEAAYNGQGGVMAAAERAEERKFFTFGNAE
jgi:type IV secretion system protein VirB5